MPKKRLDLGKCGRLVTEHKCAICKKVFFIRCPLYQYGWTAESKCGTLLFCSYTCMRTYEKPRVKKSKEKAKKQIEKIAEEENDA